MTAITMKTANHSAARRSGALKEEKPGVGSSVVLMMSGRPHMFARRVELAEEVQREEHRHEHGHVADRVRVAHMRIVVGNAAHHRPQQFGAPAGTAVCHDAY